MSRLRVAFHCSAELENETFALEALDIATALTVADINLGSGGAEIWEGDHRLARLAKLGGKHATFWRVG